ncbi:MAG: FAD binding domain-containing protein [Desulfuromonadaceae bacterium]|nr:FAD binding domain-containing protein [Desulfuromonadaceae bacterium]
MRPFTHINARTVKQAVTALAQQNGAARLNAGGTDLFGLLKDEYLPAYPDMIVNIKTIAGLNYIKEDKNFLRIGALTRLADISKSSLLRQRYAVLADAAHSVATPQIRNVATLGGNLCQDVRCCYYRYPRHIGGPIQCARKGSGACLAVTGDNRNHAILGGKRCFAVCPSDTAVALTLYDARLLVVGPGGERQIAVGDFYTPLKNGLRSDEMVREIQIPRLPEVPQQTFLKFTLRKPIDFAVVSVAALVSQATGICTEARIALGAVAPGIVRADAAEKFLRGRPLTAETAAQAAELALADARPLSRNAYKINIATALVTRALLGQKECEIPPDEVKAYNPTELSTFHRCSSSTPPGYATVVESGTATP